MMKKLLIILLTSFSFHSMAMVGLKVGQKAPSIILKDTQGADFSLAKQKGKTILLFYRGSWCPYCVRQLQDVAKNLSPKLKNAKVVAISVDKMNVAKKMRKKFKLPFLVLSDPLAISLKSFNLVNKVSDELVQKYKSSYKIDIERDSGQTHHMIAHPGVFIVEKGMITFSDVHTDYKQRTQISDILKALK